MSKVRSVAAQSVSAALAAVVLLGGCTGGDTEPPRAEQTRASTSASPTPEASAAPSAAASGEAIVIPPPASQPQPTPNATGPGQSLPPGATSLPVAPLPPEQSAAATGFADCAQEYQQLVDGAQLGGAVTPVLLEQWAQAYEAAAATSADGDLAGAAAACNALVAEMQQVLG